MAKVGTAYVEIKPDLSGFARELREKLKLVDVEHKVPIKPDLTGFSRELKERLDAANAPKMKIQLDPDIVGLMLRLRAWSQSGFAPEIRLQVVPDFRYFLRTIREKLKLMRLPVVRLPVEVDDVWVQRAMKELAKPVRQAGVDAADVWGFGFSKGFATFMKNPEIGQSILGALGGGKGGPITLGLVAAGIAAAGQFVVAMAGSLIGLLGALSLVGLGIFGQRNDKEIKARAKKLGQGFVKELTNATKSFKMPIMSSLDIVFAGFTEALKILKPALDAIAPVLPELAAGFSGFLTEIAKGLADPQTRAAFVSFLKTMAEELPKVGQAIGDLFRTIGQHSKELTATLRVFFGIVSALFDILNGAIALSADNIKVLIVAFRFFKVEFTVVMRTVKEAWGQAWTWMLTKVISTFTSVAGKVQGAFDNIKASVSLAINTMINFFAGMKERIMSNLAGVGSWLWSVGRDLILGLVRGIGDFFGEVDAKIRELFNRIPEWARKLIGANSPSTVMAAIGQDMTAGLILGMVDDKAGVLNAASKMAGWATPSMGTPAFAGMNNLGVGVPGVRVFIGDRELTDIVRVEVDDVNHDTARALVAGRRQ
jgi:hypothetical protein